MKTRIFIAAAMASSIAVAAFAHSGATGVVKERMVGMSTMSDAVKSVTPLMSGAASYDADTVREAAEAIRAHAGETMTKLFPEGSGGGVSKAKEAVWSEWEEFASLADQLDVYAEGLGLAAENGLGDEGEAAMDAGSMMGGGSDMMGGGESTADAGSMMGGGAPAVQMLSVEELAEMPADAAFDMVTQTCSSCHTKFRTEAK